MTASIPAPAVGRAERVDSDVGAVWFRADDDVMRPAVRSTGLWEAGETRLLQRLIRPGHRFLDVGAHVGWFSLVAHRAAAGVSIDAVEPDPFTARLCEINLFNSSANARVWTCGLGAARESLGFVSSEHNPGDSRVVEDSMATTVVPILAADELFPDARFDVIKVDVQGYEEPVLLGMTAIIRRSTNLRLLVEFFPRAIAESGARPGDVLRRYRSEGFDIHALIGDQLSEPADDDLISMCSNAGPEGFVTLLLAKRS